MTFTKEQEKIFQRLRKCEQGAFGRISAYVVLKPNTKDDSVIYTPHNIAYGKIQVAYPVDGAGRLQVFVWDYEHDLQYGSANGCGYDKLSAALHGLKFDAITFTDHPHNWEMQLREAGYTVIQAV